MRNLSTRAAGLLILAMGIWGGLVPFVGSYFHFALGPDKSWTWTTGRLWLSVLPGAVAVLGGLMLLGAGPRPGGKLGALLALAAGIWFAIGPQVSLLWNASGAQGAAHGSTGIRVLEMLTYHTLLGCLMAALAGYALPGLVTRRTAVASEPDRPLGDDVEPAPVAPVTRRPSRIERSPAGVGARGTETDARGAGTEAGTVVRDRPGAEDRVQATEDRAAEGDGRAPATNGAADEAARPATNGAADEAARPATNGAPEEQPVGSTVHNGDSASAPEAQTSEPQATTTVRRRRGGLLSALRR